MTLGNSTWYYDSKKATSNGEFLSNTLKKKVSIYDVGFRTPQQPPR